MIIIKCSLDFYKQEFQLFIIYNILNFPKQYIFDISGNIYLSTYFIFDFIVKVSSITDDIETVQSFT